MPLHQTFLNVKATESAGDRFITGWATTPAPDLVGDIVDPEGAKFALPLPLLFAHRHDEPVGAVIEAKTTKAGIRIRAKLTAGVNRAEEIWKLIADGALTAVSIGFMGVKSTPLPGGGKRFDEWLWHELSIVSVPCNPQARIVVGKSAVYTATQEPDQIKKQELPPYRENLLDIRKDFLSACASVPHGSKADDRLSSKPNGHWHLRDSEGFLLAVVPPLPGSQKPTQPAANKQGSRHVTIEGLTAFGEEVGKLIGKSINKLKARVDQLDASVSALASIASKHAPAFQPGLSYHKDSVVRHGGSLFLATQPAAPCADPDGASCWQKIN